MSLLELKNVTQRFGGVVAVNDVTMSVEEGEKRGLDGADRRMWVSFEPTKTNYGPPIDSIWLTREAGGLLVPGDPPEAQGRGGGQL